MGSWQGIIGREERVQCIRGMDCSRYPALTDAIRMTWQHLAGCGLLGFEHPSHSGSVQNSVNALLELHRCVVKLSQRSDGRGGE